MKEKEIVCVGIVSEDLSDLYYEFDIPTDNFPVMEDIKAIFSNDGKYRIEHTDIGLGANIEALLCIISLPFTLIGGLSGIIYLAEKFTELKKKWREKTKGTLLFPPDVAFAICAPKVFSDSQLDRIRLLNHQEIKIGPEWAKLGSCPFIYCYIVGIETDEENVDEVHALVLRDDGEILLHQQTRANLFLKMFGKISALDELFINGSVDVG